MTPRYDNMQKFDLVAQIGIFDVWLRRANQTRSSTYAFGIEWGRRMEDYLFEDRIDRFLARYYEKTTSDFVLKHAEDLDRAITALQLLGVPE